MATRLIPKEETDAHQGEMQLALAQHLGNSSFTVQNLEDPSFLQ